MALINDNHSIRVSQRSLRYLVPRMLRVAERHASHPAIRLASAPVVERGKAFTDRYDARDYTELTRARVAREAEVLSEQTADAFRALAPVLALLWGFDAGAFAPKSDRPDQVIVAVRRFVEYVDQADGAPSGEASEAIESLRILVERAAERLTEARALRIEVQTQAQGVREAAARFHAALVVFRRVLAVVLGRSHLDYQTLRASRTSRDDAAVEIVDDAPVASEDTAPADAASPVEAPDEDRPSGEFDSVTSEAS